MLYKSLFNSNDKNICDYDKLEMKINFRSHGKIIKLSHIIIELIYYFFAYTMDKVKLDYSMNVEENFEKGIGCTPYILPVDKLDLFIKILPLALFWEKNRN